mmetsp:Transcript_11467/g.42793  ORF Transcript_11467/g.42793 Transcript_11467/m.42793 type:complete len:302 (-) Transcript_11467:593-1498(-)
MEHQVFDGREEDALTTAALVVGGASFLGCAAILRSFWRFTQLRTFSFRVIMMLALADMGSVVSYFFGSPENSTLSCTVQAFLQQFFQLASVFWTSGIALTVYDTAVSHTTPTMLRLNLLCWGVPFLAALLPLVTGSYGSTGAWCWIQATPGDQEDPFSRFYVGTFWRFALFYVPIWICIFLNVGIYVYVTRYVNTFGKVSESRETTLKLVKLIHRLRFYPLVLVIAWLPATVNRIHDALYPSTPVFWLTMIAVLTKSAQGLLNALTYGFNRTVREAWKQDLFKRWVRHFPDSWTASASLSV